MVDGGFALLLLLLLLGCCLLLVWLFWFVTYLICVVTFNSFVLMPFVFMSTISLALPLSCLLVAICFLFGVGCSEFDWLVVLLRLVFFVVCGFDFNYCCFYCFC